MAKDIGTLLPYIECTLSLSISFILSLVRVKERVGGRKREREKKASSIIYVVLTSAFDTCLEATKSETAPTKGLPQ